MGVNAAEVWISIDKSVDYDKTVAAVRSVVDGYPGLYRDVETYLNERIEEVLSGAKEAIVVRVYGQDLGEMRSEAAQVLGAFSGVPGVIDQHVDLSVDVPQIQVEVNLAKAARYGLKPGDVRRCAAAMVAGLEMGNVFKDDQVYGVVVWSTPSDARQPLGHQRPHDRHAVRRPGAPRRRGQRQPAVRPLPRDPRERLALHRRRGQRPGARPGVGGARHPAAPQGHPVRPGIALRAARASTRSGRPRSAACSRPAIIAAIVIFLLLQLAFGSWRLATFVFLTLPMSLVGGVIAIYIGGGVITIGALVGLLHRLRHRRPQRHPADQPLPAPGASTRARRSGPPWSCAARASGSRRSS